GERAAARLRGGLERLYEMFEKAPYLGSLIDPRRAVSGDFGNLFEEGFEGLESLLGKVLEGSGSSYEAREAAVTAQGVAKAAELLSRTYSLIATNVPYLTRNKQHEVTRAFVDAHYPDGRSDIATVFVDRLLSMIADSGTEAV